jgi:hypothetical protein
MAEAYERPGRLAPGVAAIRSASARISAGSRLGSRHGSAKTTSDTYGHLWPDKDESTKAVIDALVDSKFRDLADSLPTEAGARRDAPQPQRPTAGQQS